MSQEAKPRSLPLPPGPEGTCILGNYSAIDQDQVHRSLESLARTHGPVVYLNILGKKLVVLNSPEAIRLGLGSAEYRELFNDKAKGFVGTYVLYDKDIVFGPYADVTFRIKSIMHDSIKPMLAEDRIRKEAENLMEIFQNANGSDIEPNSVFEKLLSDNQSKLLGDDPQPGDCGMMWDFVRWVNQVMHPSVEATLVRMPCLRRLPIHSGTLYRRTVQARDRVTRRYFDEYKKTYDPEKQRGLVDMCLKVQQTEKGADGRPWLQDDRIRALIIDVIGAGLDGVKNQLLSTLLHLLHNPDCFGKMFEELMTVIGDKALPTGSDIDRLPYCHAVCLEASRIASVLPFVNHYCSAKDTEFMGFLIPRGSIITGNLWYAHHSESVWGDPWKFRPERFIDHDGGLLSSDHKLRQSLFPLGLGARYCVGNRYALHRIFVYVTSLVQNFELLPPETETLPPSDPREYGSAPVLQAPLFKCRVSTRDKT